MGGLFEVHDAKKCALLAWRPKRAYLCTKYASEDVFGYLGWGDCLKCGAKKGAFLAWRPKRAYLCTKYASNSILGYLGWGRLKCAMPKNVRFWRGGPSAHTFAPNMPAKVLLDT